MAAALAERQPVISVDTKKKELVGDFKNAGRGWRHASNRPQGNPEEVRVHDFLLPELGRAVPYGLYDLAANAGWVSVGMNHDTASFAVQTIRRWWQEIGRVRYPAAERLVITADGGGSNGSRLRLWKYELQGLADEIALAIEVHHLPPGTSKWNSIEHRLFSFISMNWRAKPLVSYRVIVDLISATTTTSGLTVHCELDQSHYPKGVAVSEDPKNRWPPSTSPATTSMANGTTPSNLATTQMKQLFPDKPLVFHPWLRTRRSRAAGCGPRSWVPPSRAARPTFPAPGLRSLGPQAGACQARPRWTPAGCRTGCTASALKPVGPGHHPPMAHG